jgi:hypothetical protein
LPGDIGEIVGAAVDGIADAQLASMRSMAPP